MQIDPIISIRNQVASALRHLFSEQNRNMYSATYGCFDRRYWGWKLTDYPEATFQRNVYPLAWAITHPDLVGPGMPETLTEAVKSGLIYAARIQHEDGSFDQAFPHEHSFGATAFLLHDLLKAFRIIRGKLSPSDWLTVNNSLLKASDFLCKCEEQHALIANHLAGAALSLFTSAEFFQDIQYAERAKILLERILACQSSEGWFLEYDGADPGYQSLCMYYLAQIYLIKPDERLRTALEMSIDFLSWFAHPDGSFGGEYGSRRTAVFYPGGLALLSKEFPLARSLTRFIIHSASEGKTIALNDIDMGNLSPLLSNYILLLSAGIDAKKLSPPLPCEQEAGEQYFRNAGLYIHNSSDYYAILGISNGGVLKVFDKGKRRLLWNDAGYIGRRKKQKYITTQMTNLENPCRISSNQVQLEVSFYQMLRSIPEPHRFVALRLLNLTVMRFELFRLWVKNILVWLLISGKHRVPLKLDRLVHFEKRRILIRDTLRLTKPMDLQYLAFGCPFVSIHMASAQYFENCASATIGLKPIVIDTNLLCEDRTMINESTIEL